MKIVNPKTALRRLFDSVMARRCPCCHSSKVRRLPRKNLVEFALLPFVLGRPFRCQRCNTRFYDLILGRSVPYWDAPSEASGTPLILPVVVYGRQQSQEPFREQTNIRMVSAHAGVVTLATDVEPSQELLVTHVETEEDQRGRVAFVTEKQGGRSSVGIRFSHPAWGFWRLADAAPRS